MGLFRKKKEEKEKAAHLAQELAALGQDNIEREGIKAKMHAIGLEGSAGIFRRAVQDIQGMDKHREAARTSLREGAEKAFLEGSPANMRIALLEYQDDLMYKSSSKYDYRYDTCYSYFCNLLSRVDNKSELIERLLAGTDSAQRQNFLNRLLETGIEKNHYSDEVLISIIKAGAKDEDGCLLAGAVVKGISTEVIMVLREEAGSTVKAALAAVTSKNSAAADKLRILQMQEQIADLTQKLEQAQAAGKKPRSAIQSKQ